MAQEEHRVCQGPKFHMKSETSETNGKKFSVLLLFRNAAISTYQAPPHLAQVGELWAADRSIPSTLIISCADPRCHPETIFNLNASHPADAAIVIRVQGGDFQTALPAVLAIDKLINFTHTILLKHIDCGSLVFRDEKVEAQLKERVAASGSKLQQEVEAMRFGENTIPMEENVRRDLRWLRESPLLSEEIKKRITEMLFHLDSGKVEVIE